jgi:hypothetical protein
MYERFTDRARKVLQLANQEAQRFNHEYIGTEHILLGLVKVGAGVAANVLKNFDIDLRKIRLEVEKIVQPGPDAVFWGKLPQTPRAKQVINYAIEEAKNLKNNYVGTEHLLLGLIREEDTVAGQVLLNLGLRQQDVRKEVLQLLGYEIASEEKIGGPALVRRWARSRRKPEGASQGEPQPSADSERIRSLEQQLWNVRVVLGALVGTIAGAVLLAPFGAVIGLLVGGLVAALGWRILGGLAGLGVGGQLGYTHLHNEGGGLSGALLGAVLGFLIAEIGGATDGRGFLGFWRKR